MKLFVLVLNRTEKLNDLMLEFADKKICGATIIDSTGLARELYNSNKYEEDLSFLGSIFKHINPDDDHIKSKTILTVIRDEQQDTIIRIVNEVIGSFSEPNTGIMFTIPLDYVCGKGL